MTADRSEVDGASRAARTFNNDGLELRATHRGALVLQTDNARRMMRRLRKLKSAPPEDADPAADAPGTAPVTP
jgi:hypothetical protein